MPFLSVGGITIDGVRLNTDPGVYRPIEWEKRYSVQKAIGGIVTIQDFGMWAADSTIHLQGDESRPLEEAVVKALHDRFRTRGAAYTMTDWIGNAFSVFITKFTAEPYRKGRDAEGNIVSLYKYDMELQVVSITTLFGASYSEG